MQIAYPIKRAAWIMRLFFVTCAKSVLMCATDRSCIAQLQLAQTIHFAFSSGFQSFIPEKGMQPD
ncbi:hypothetical protein PSP6_150010 [Paraburkholderia tropica]|nr:hypothetical protein PSP6_150010 [Paraburkholderia tropica]